MKKQQVDYVRIKREDFEKILKYVHQYDTKRTPLEKFIEAGKCALTEIEETGELHEPFESTKLIT